VTHRLEFVAETTCIQCAAIVRVPFGQLMAVFGVGAELVGVLCDACLTKEPRAELARLRGAIATRWTNQ
jgi:hypothetical protein